MDAREMLDRAEQALANADAQLRVASAIAHVTHRGAILTQQRGG